jgi:EAL domain-containing protein (putative c-di-GMP-specific phosphodiesterase class I)
VYQALRETMLEPSRLVLELTESILMESARERDVLDELRAIGLRISIDDFGTGYSSLAYLTQFPLDSLKIDRSFVTGIDQNPDGIAIISAIVAMARSLGLKVVAEGVETLEELAVLRKQGCDEIQGYLFSKAVPADVIATYLREGRRLET